ncbi:putative F-box protein [Iris pallida]|uniref:F-box protein n=1 Tax=Iris pallida TaxID=29817 RepID=A0AAX6GHT1_IRIPA|nr:putative F-box protein [Iris pallida]
MGCWQDLPSDVVRSLAASLHGVDDLARLAVTCRSWSEALTGYRPAFTSPQFPWLVPTALYELQQVPMYSPNTCRFHRFPPPTPFLGRGTRVVGRHHGWLVVLDASLRVHVFNPVTGDRARRSLPAFPKEVHVRKVALSSSPSAAAAGNDGIDVVAAAAVYDGFDKAAIIFARAGDDAWTGRIRLPFPYVAEVAYCHRGGGNFFVMNPDGLYQIVNPSGPVGAPAWIGPAPFQSFDIFKYSSLVSSPSSGHLLAVGRVEWSLSMTISRTPVVRKFNPPDAAAASSGGSSSSCWVEIKDLGDESLFVGGGHAMLLPAGGSGNRIRKNCIYYSGGFHSSSNSELFDMDKGIFEPLPGPPKSCLFWFLPSLS